MIREMKARSTSHWEVSRRHNANDPSQNQLRRAVRLVVQGGSRQDSGGMGPSPPPSAREVRKPPRDRDGTDGSGALAGRSFVVCMVEVILFETSKQSEPWTVSPRVVFRRRRKEISARLALSDSTALSNELSVAAMGNKMSSVEPQTSMPGGGVGFPSWPRRPLNGWVLFLGRSGTLFADRWHDALRHAHETTAYLIRQHSG